MNQTQLEFNRADKELRKNFALINALKYASCEPIITLKDLFKNPLKKAQIETQSVSFQEYLTSTISKNYAQVRDIERAGMYITKYKINVEDLLDIPISLVGFLEKNHVEWSDDLYHELISNHYSKIKKTYGK